MALTTDAAGGGKGEETATAAPAGGRFRTLVLGSIGVVYGDIGTSPLYAVRESVRAAGGTAAGSETVLGILSLIFWALMLVVTAKYIIIILRIDNNGEGGTLALMAFAQRALKKNRRMIIALGIVGAALFYGDAMLTPAISVISAVEGLSIVTPAFEPYILPITVGVILVLFAMQSRGTGRVASLFGPVTLVWFAALAALGIGHIAAEPAVLAALNPAYAVGFLANHGVASIAVVGAVFLAVTGAEALYADLGHFGRKPIRTAWLLVVAPALVLNYFGQGALLLTRPDAIDNPFFLMVPEWALVPMVLLATAATVIASQAVISGAFSLSRQAVQLGFLPRLEIRHTSAVQFGQVYMPRINVIVAIGVILLVLLFRSSSGLAGAYGIAVSGTMVVTSILAFLVVRDAWHWRAVGAVLLIGPFLLIDLTFFGANLLKVAGGGWVPLAIAAALAILIISWRRGARLLADKTRRTELPLGDLVRNIEAHPPPRVPGTAVFLTSDPTSAPTALLHSLKHYKVLHEKNAVLTVEAADTPRVDADQRVRMEPIGESFLRVVVRYGFMERPNVPKALAIARKLGWSFDIMTTSFFLSRRSLREASKRAVPHWQFRLFALLARNADDATNYFQIPSARVIEIGTQVQL